MFPTPFGHRPLRRTAGTMGAVALLALGAAPVAADGPEPEPGLVLEEIAPVDGVKPGKTFTVPARFTYTGTEALDKVWVRYTVSHGLSLGQVPSNCRSYKTWGYDEIPSGALAICAFDRTVEPGVVYAVEGGLRIDAMDRALYERLYVNVTDLDSVPGDEATSGPVQGTGPALELVEQPDAPQAKPGTPVSEDAKAKRGPVTVTVDNTADFQATGAALKGRVGDTVEFKAGFTNAGPAWVDQNKAGVPDPRILVRMPAGTTVTKSGNCAKVSPGTYRCSTNPVWIDEGDRYAYPFKLRIDKAVAGAKGSVTLEDGPRPYDSEKDNDTADITLDVTGASGGSGGSAAGGSSSTGGNGSTGGSGATGGSSTDGGSGTDGPTTGSTDGGAPSGDLASTGSSSALPVAGAAAAAVGVGAAIILVVRRRRTARG
ncbi:hypothetical protein ACFYW9_27625 [Streptomyces sp. NPDC002698]|uniref:hypothetical protein n=1 Tax=Streptomyces sp. NPDC002698 TaxID=3364660 RepID=UPI0036B3034C